MAQRPSFDLTRLPTADKILGVGAFLLFVDSFLAWQRFLCIGDIVGLPGRCLTANAWQGNGSFFGVLMGLFAIILLVGVILSIAGVEMPPNISVPTVMSVLTLGTVLFALIKFLFVIGNRASYGAWIGLILAIVIAYGGYMKMQEAKAVSPPGDTGFTA
jgi:hypothetical protein